eukprot:10036168-Prorocentrum_lima.AAC.1
MEGSAKLSQRPTRLGADRESKIDSSGLQGLQAYTENIKTYSGTAAKWAQHAVNAHAAQMNHT